MIDFLLGSRYSASWLSQDKPALLSRVSWSSTISPCLPALSPLFPLFSPCFTDALLSVKSLDSPLISLPFPPAPFLPQFSHCPSVLHSSAPSITNTLWRFPNQLHHRCPKETLNKVVLNLLLGSTQVDNYSKSIKIFGRSRRRF